ncbi:fumarylacetoacetate hydrolase family protein [Luteibaculum oceani]|uniref:Fumarylacetoacetate hydrolase family protein n=1 Tax=Luteibaculum oceani TaxID=1294296 RepID=A0A5C6VE82_9FLAO|nr:fumarylacetoacetate hydrolase family protein [Luteibaculum oceani]TXC82095.1 fumarylacetoacetate hydrolase family protein [Luteibaculum oceani]
MRLLTYRQNNQENLGFKYDGKVYNMEAFGKAIGKSLPNSMLEFIDLGLEKAVEIGKDVKHASTGDLSKCEVSQNDFKVLAPIPKPRKNIIGIGLNYTEHVAESARSLDTDKALPQQPVIFCKPTTAVCGPDDYVLLDPKLTKQLDWECELAVIIGKKGKYVENAKALDYVYGYTVINDISARDCRRQGQWIVSKGQDTFAPMGPEIVTADEITDPHNLNLWLKKNGVEKQNSNTKFMLFNVNDLIEDISTVFTVEPGDIIATGTPAGVGAGRTPQEWLQPGDVIESTVEGIGTIVNTVKEVVR